LNESKIAIDLYNFMRTFIYIEAILASNQQTKNNMKISSIETLKPCAFCGNMEDLRRGLCGICFEDQYGN